MILLLFWTRLDTRSACAVSRESDSKKTGEKAVGLFPAFICILPPHQPPAAVIKELSQIVHVFQRTSTAHHHVGLRVLGAGAGHLERVGNGLAQPDVTTPNNGNSVLI